MDDAELRGAPLTLSAGELLLDRYRVAETIGEGGHSRVYRGYDERLERPVCIKLFHRLGKHTRAYQASYDNFIREAFSLSKLAHPSTLRIYDFGHVRDDGPPFQVTELADGGTLTTAVRDAGPLPNERVADLVTGLCGALSEAHGHGIVHRDIKPSNVLIATAGATSVLKLADFGIAKALASSEETGQPRMYSRRWAAPEQMTNYPVTAASDIYSLALVVVFALTGRAVFRQSDAGAAYAERTASYERISELLEQAEVPESARVALKEACSFDPRHRPASADVLCLSLTSALGASPGGSQVPIPAPAESPASRPPLRPRLSLSGPTAQVGNQRIRIIPALQAEADIPATDAIRLRLTLVPTAGEHFCAHIKALGRFVKTRGGRPSRAIQLTKADTIDVVAPNGEVLASARVSLGWREADDLVLRFGDMELAAAANVCRYAALIDLGSTAESAFVFLPRQADATASQGSS